MINYFYLIDDIIYQDLPKEYFPLKLEVGFGISFSLNRTNNDITYLSKEAWETKKAKYLKILNQRKKLWGK